MAGPLGRAWFPIIDGSFKVCLLLQPRQVAQYAKILYHIDVYIFLGRKLIM
jgi:hypothetical protein